MSPIQTLGTEFTHRLRIEQYFQIQDYALWDVIENGNSFKPVAETTTDDAGTSTTLIPGPITIEKKAKKKNDVKARSMLLMALPKEHLMTFNQHKDAKTLFAAIKTRLSGNEATKKTQKTLLKQLYKNFSATRTESLDLIFNRLLKLISQLAILGVFFSQEDLNLKFLRNNQPNGSQLMHEDLEQIHKDDLDEIDLMWQLALLSMRAKRFFQKIGKKITINGSDTAGYDKSKIVNVEDTSSKAMVVIDGAGFVWSYMADDEAPTNMAFMALSDSEESDEEDEVESPLEKERKTVEPSMDKGHSHKQIEDQGYFNGGCSRRMRGNISYLTDFKEFDEGYVAFEGGTKGGKFTGKRTIRIGKLDFKDMYFVKELQFNFFNVSQIFTWIFFLTTKDETSRILKSFIDEIENLVDKKVKIIKYDNGIEFKNRVMNKFCKEKARTMLANSKLPIIFWAEAVNTACYVQNSVLLVKPHFKTSYELFRGRTPALSFMRLFGCHVTIIITLDHLGKFDGKLDKGFFVGYSTNSKAFKVYNTRTRKVEENLHIKFLNNKPLITGDGPKWLFNIDTLTESMNYIPVIAERPNAENSTKDVSTVRPSINTASSNINTASPIVNTVRQSDDFFGTDNDMTSLDGVEVDISNISATYHVLTTPNTRIYKDYSLDNVIGDIQSGMDVKSASLYGRIEEEVYVCQPSGFEDPDYPDKVYKVEKALFGLYQAPRAWYETLAKYLLDNGYRRGKIDQTLFIKRQKEDIPLVQVHVDNIIFRSTKKDCVLSLRSMIGSLIYLTLSRPDVIFAGEGPTSPIGNQHTPTIIESSPHLQNISITYRKTRTRTGRMNIRIPQSNVLSSAANETITKDMHNGLGRATTNISSLEAEQRKCPVRARPERLSNLPNEPPLEEADSKAGYGSSKVGKSLKRSAEEELGHEQKVEEEIAQQEDVVAKQAEKERSMKTRGRLKKERLQKLEKTRTKDKRNKMIKKTHTYRLCGRDVGYYKIHKAYGSYKTYIFFSEMLNYFDREYLIMFYRLYNKKYASTRPGFDDLMLWGDIKIMFKPDDDDEV
nr:hypothetical protein [Tanacetum cinerariifolium]